MEIFMKTIFKLSKTDKNPEDFDQDQLEKGIEVEKEHTRDEKKAEQVAMDHLEESKDFKDGKGAKYYDKLDKMEEEIKDELKDASRYFDLMKFASITPLLKEGGLRSDLQE